MIGDGVSQWDGGSDFYEDDEPIEHVREIMARSADTVTAPPPGWTGPVREAPSLPGDSSDKQ